MQSLLGQRATDGQWRLRRAEFPEDGLRGRAGAPPCRGRCWQVKGPEGQGAQGPRGQGLARKGGLRKGRRKRVAPQAVGPARDPSGAACRGRRRRKSQSLHSQEGLWCLCSPPQLRVCKARVAVCVCLYEEGLWS